MIKVELMVDSAAQVVDIFNISVIAVNGDCKASKLQCLQVH